MDWNQTMVGLCGLLYQRAYATPCQYHLSPQKNHS